MHWGWDNIDWNGTGAMVQAVGSVAAILAAIWIDQGAARRLRQGGDPEPELVFALSRSAHCLKAGFRTIDRTGMIFARQRVSLANELRGLADEIELELSQKSDTR